MKKWLQAIGIVATILIGLSSCSNDELVNADDFSSVFDALDWGNGATTYVIGQSSTSMLQDIQSKRYGKPSDSVAEVQCSAY